MSVDDGSARVLRALVVEDEWPARQYLVEILQSSGMVHVAAAVATLAEAQLALGPNGVTVDVAFVDINLATSGGERAGMALVKSLAESSPAPAVVLTTALKKYAVDAFDLGVTDYLLKPFSRERVRRALEKLRASLSRAAPPPLQQRVVARNKRGLVSLGLDEVWAFEAANRLTFVHTTHARFDIDLSLSALESSLGPQFSRVHRNWLVNTAHIKALERCDGETVLCMGSALQEPAQGLRVPVAQERAAAVREMLLCGATGIRR